MEKCRNLGRKWHIVDYADAEFLGRLAAERRAEKEVLNIVYIVGL